MKVYLGFDDTDAHGSPYGTGKLVRWFQNLTNCRYQLPVIIEYSEVSQCIQNETIREIQ